jgi:hypothetical protein
MTDKMTDNEIVKALEDAEYRRDGITLRGFYLDHEIIKQVIDLINRQKAEIERLKKSNRNWRRKVQRLRADNNEKIYKLECLLCYSTSGKLSKHTYPLDTMERYVNDTIQEYCEEAEKEAKSEAYKEFAERLCEGRVSNDNTVILAKCLLKELVGDENG